MSRPGISMLMPAFNGGDFVLEAAELALGQMSEHDELVVQDGGSTDGSVERLRERFGHVPQLKLVSAPDRGQSHALNLALERAANPVIGWLNADDLLYDGALDAVRRAWTAQADLDIVYGTWQVFDEAGAPMRVVEPTELTLRSIMWKPHVFSGALFFRTAMVREAGGFDEAFYLCMDVDLVMRLLSVPRRTGQVPEVLAGFRWHGNSKTGRTDLRVVTEAFACRRKYAQGPRAQAEAYAFSAVHLAAFAATPVRRSRAWSAWRLRRARWAGRTPV